MLGAEPVLLFRLHSEILWKNKVRYFTVVGSCLKFFWFLGSVHSFSGGLQEAAFLATPRVKDSGGVFKGIRIPAKIGRGLLLLSAHLE